jgi:lipoprotein-releasing system permease protein
MGNIFKKKKKYHHAVNAEIAYTHITTRKRQTFIAALGVTIGMAIFIFMNSLMAGFDRSSIDGQFKISPHLRVYSDDQKSLPLVPNIDSTGLYLITNPKVTATQAKRLLNPKQLIKSLSAHPAVKNITPEVSLGAFYSSGSSAQISGIVAGVALPSEDEMFDLQRKIIIEGDVQNLATNVDGIIIGTGLAQKLSLRIGDNLSLNSGVGVSKNMKIVAIFQTNITNIDKTKAYINLAAAQQLLRQNQDYITDIKINIHDYQKTADYQRDFEQISGYQVEDWKAANSALVAAANVRRAMAFSIAMSILLVAGFGIYNIMNMTVMQKINDIAILKALGFAGGDVIKIFVYQSIIIAFVGVLMGLGMATFMVNILSRVWVGGDMGFFPIRVEPFFYALGSALGAGITLLAGFIPARKAANIDPVAILRK